VPVALEVVYLGQLSARVLLGWLLAQSKQLAYHLQTGVTAGLGEAAKTDRRLVQ
jgi:hypothetical protein